MRTTYVIGAGGIGSWLIASLCRLEDPDRVVVIDRDTLEEKNLDRQLFSPENIGQAKAAVLAEKYGCMSIIGWFSYGMLKLSPQDWLIACVDNHPSRKEALDEGDRTNCNVIVACNETTSAEAFVYFRHWKESPLLDPRVYYPEINKPHGGDPRGIAIGCTGEAQRENRQLVSANMMAAALAQHLFVAWAKELPKCRNKKTIIPFMPHRLNANASLIQTETVGDKPFRTGQ